ncbi:cytochrome P450 [Rhodococcus koreensis]|uniref:Cytochrome P450 n=1 Tax=Rhodococcus koreensis TaxID=99653 RepID=A0A1H4L0A9_9NOCA|nr:cytochrome P450 [Rhodococcus koreensis]SEB64161.1 Cytochrome P450 [Rhodococcus koreensis]
MIATDLRSIDASIMEPAWYSNLDFLEGFRQLRDEDPVRLVEAPNYPRPFWAVTRHEDVKWCFQNAQLLSSREGARMPRAATRTTAERRIELGLDTRLDYLDDPVHAMYRRPLNKHFSVPAVKRLGSDIARYVNEIVDDIAENSEFEFMEDVAAKLPTMVIGTLLGIPREEWSYLQNVTMRITAFNDPRFTVDNDPLKTFSDAYAELLDYAGNLAMDRRKNPRDDFATIMGQMKVDHELLSPREVRSPVVGMILGGFDTTRLALGVGAWQLVENSEQRRAMLDDPALVLGAVDETVRFASPARSTVRVANEDFELQGKLIRTGDWVSLVIMSANRDERVFENPLEFDIRRAPNDYLSFGEGIHKCLGRNLIRLELSQFYSIFFSRLPDLEIVERPTWVVDTAASGLSGLTVRTGKVLPAQSAN